MNPLDYSPAQIAKAIIAGLTATVGLLGMAAGTFTDGPLSAVGHWAAAVALFLVPILVFVQKAAPVIDLFNRRGGEDSAGADVAAGD
jgi:hypothetical protein